MVARAKARATVRRIRPPRTMPARAPVSSALSARLIDGTAPRPSRSSGTNVMPSARRASGGSAAACVPQIVRLPEVHAARFAGQRRHQLLLPVARDAGDAHDLARAHLEVQRVQRGAERLTRRLRITGQHQLRRPRLAGREPAGLQLAADHEARARLSLLSSAGRAVPTTRPPRSTVGGVAQLADLVELVADVQHAHSFAGQPPQRREQHAHGLWRQHRGGLVHDEQPRRLQQAAHDLDALALAHRHAVHQSLRIEWQP